MEIKKLAFGFCFIVITALLILLSLNQVNYSLPIESKCPVNVVLSESGVYFETNNSADVLSVSDGLVVYADNGLKGFGNLILIKQQDYVFAYGNLKNIAVTEGQAISKGMVIGSSSGQFLFEVRTMEAALTVNQISSLLTCSFNEKN